MSQTKRRKKKKKTSSGVMGPWPCLCHCTVASAACKPGTCSLLGSDPYYIVLDRIQLQDHVTIATCETTKYFDNQQIQSICACSKFSHGTECSVNISLKPCNLGTSNLIKMY